MGDWLFQSALSRKNAILPDDNGKQVSVRIWDLDFVSQKHGFRMEAETNIINLVSHQLSNRVRGSYMFTSATFSVTAGWEGVCIPIGNQGLLLSLHVTSTPDVRTSCSQGTAAASLLTWHRFGHNLAVMKVLGNDTK